MAVGAMLLAVQVAAYAQQPTSTPEMGIYAPGQLVASLHHGLAWRRTSPTVQQPDGPVLYQLIFNASGVPGTVPVFDTNPRHLANSPIAISSGNVVIGGGSALNINGSSGIITFAPGQTFPASGLPNLAGEVTGAPSATVVSNAVSANTANGIVRRDGSGSFAAGEVALSGNLDLPTTSSSSAGVITLGATPFLHDFGGNTFVGAFAGNFTTTSSHNTAVGYGALQNDTSGGTNAALGDGALFSNTTGYGNTAAGSAALDNNSIGNTNSAFGYLALVSNTIASGNSAFGASSLFYNTTGSGNAAFGYNALTHNTTASNNAAFGYGALAANTTASGNAAFGSSALNANTIGASNSAFGSNALSANTSGTENSAFGNSALSTNSGNLNSAFGSGALFVNNTGFDNSAFGAHALLLLSSNGSGNSAFGANALRRVTTGDQNTAFGEHALDNLGAGGNGGANIAIGAYAGTSLQSGDYNIYLGSGSDGAPTESDTIRIGFSFHKTTFIAGIYGSTSASGTNVFVNSNGQLGTATSSLRYKQDIADLGAESDVLMQLRPVAFYYKPELDETHTRQYGLVAEEVAQIAPGLVLFDQDGRPQTVRYHFVNAMLLNEVQKQRRLIEAQQKQNEAQQQQIEHLRAALKTEQAAQQAEMLSLREEVKQLRDLLQKSGAGVARLHGDERRQ
jgi:hypothetical protein